MKIEALLLVLICSLITITTTGQKALFSDLHIFDGSGQLYPTDIKVDSDGNTLIIGNYYYDVDLDPGVDSAKYYGNYTGGISPVFVVKLDSSGNHLWSGVLPKVDWRSQRLSIDQQNNVLIAGQFVDTMDFDISDTGVHTRYSYAPYEDNFILKMDANGVFQWVKTFGRAGGIFMRDFSVDHSGNIVFTGYCEGGNLVFHPDTSLPKYNAYFRGFFVLKYDDAGGFMWLKQFGPSSQYTCKQVEVTDGNDIIVSGEFEGTADFDPGSASVNMTSQNGSEDFFVLKLDSLGQFSWVKRMGNGNNNQLYSMKLGSNNELVLMGELRDSIDFDPGSGVFFEKSKQYSSTFILMLSADNAGFKWVRSFVFTDPFQVDFNHLHVDDEGSVYTTGAFKREFYVHPDTAINNFRLPSSSQSTLTWKDAFIHKFDSSGAYQWAHSLNSNEFQRGKAVTTTPSGKVLWAGEFVNTVDFGLGGSPIVRTVDGSYDMFLLGMNQCAPLRTGIRDSVCRYYLTALGDTIHQAGKHEIRFSRLNKCDSIIELDLHILNVNKNVIKDSIGGELIATAQGATFQWLYCDSSYAPISGAGSHIFKPVVNGSYAVEINSSDGCVDTSDCIEVGFIDLGENSIQGIRIYPNPSSGEVTLDLGDINGPVMVEVIDELGRIQRNTFIDQGDKTSLSLPDQPGVYLVKVKWEGEEFLQRVVIFAD